MPEISKVVSNVENVKEIGSGSLKTSRAVADVIRQRPKETIFWGSRHGMCLYV